MILKDIFMEELYQSLPTDLSKYTLSTNLHSDILSCELEYSNLKFNSIITINELNSTALSLKFLKKLIESYPKNFNQYYTISLEKQIVSNKIILVLHIDYSEKYHNFDIKINFTTHNINDVLFQMKCNKNNQEYINKIQQLETDFNELDAKFKKEIKSKKILYIFMALIIFCHFFNFTHF